MPQPLRQPTLINILLWGEFQKAWWPSAGTTLAWRWNYSPTATGSNSPPSPMTTLSITIQWQQSITVSTSWVSDQNEIKNYYTNQIIGFKHLLGGGPRDGKAVTVGKMTDSGMKWSKGPDLLISRDGHRSIAANNIIYTISGDGWHL